MSTFLQVTAGVLLTAVLGIVLSKQNKDIAVVLTVAVCCMVLGAALSFFKPVLDFVGTLQSLGQLDTELVQILLKAVGIGIVSEVASTICTDSGNSALGKTVQMVATAVILWLSLPLMQALLDMVESILGDI